MSGWVSVLRTLVSAVLLLLAGVCAAGPWRAAEQNSYGWQFMTPDERVEHQRRLRGFDSYEGCKTYQAEHHARMAARAARQGIELQPKAHSACDQLRARGQFK